MQKQADGTYIQYEYTIEGGVYAITKKIAATEADVMDTKADLFAFMYVLIANIEDYMTVKDGTYALDATKNEEIITKIVAIYPAYAKLVREIVETGLKASVTADGVIIKDHGYTTTITKIGSTTVTFETELTSAAFTIEYLIDLGNKLLNEGFSVTIYLPDGEDTASISFVYSNGDLLMCMPGEEGHPDMYQLFDYTDDDNIVVYGYTIVDEVITVMMKMSIPYDEYYGMVHIEYLSNIQPMFFEGIEQWFVESEEAGKTVSKIKDDKKAEYVERLLASGLFDTGLAAADEKVITDQAILDGLLAADATQSMRDNYISIGKGNGTIADEIGQAGKDAMVDDLKVTYDAATKEYTIVLSTERTLVISKIGEVEIIVPQELIDHVPPAAPEVNP